MTGWTFSAGALTFTQDTPAWAGPSLTINPDGSGVATLNGGSPLPFSGLSQIDLNGAGDLTVNIVLTGQPSAPLEANLNLGAGSNCYWTMFAGDPAGNLALNVEGEQGSTPGSGGQSIFEAFLGSNASAVNLTTSTAMIAAFVQSSGQKVTASPGVNVINF